MLCSNLGFIWICKLDYVPKMKSFGDWSKNMPFLETFSEYSAIVMYAMAEGLTNILWFVDTFMKIGMIQHCDILNLGL
jgi:hypothetical protein